MNNYLDEAESKEIEIDLAELFFVVKRKLYLVIICAVIFGAVSYFYTKHMVTPKYDSSSSFLVLTKETTLSSLADLQMGSTLTNDYRQLTLSRSVLQKVVDNLQLDFDYKALKKMIGITNPDDTRIMVMTVTDIDPERACVIVDELANVASAYIGDKMEIIPPKIIESGEIDPVPVSPSMFKNVVIAAFLGIVVSVGLIVVFAMMDDTIKSEDDIVKYLGVSNLANVPDRKDYIGGKRRRRKRKKRAEGGR